MVYSYLNGMQEPTSIIVPLLLRFFSYQQICLNHCSPRPSSWGKGILYSKNEILTLVFTQNPNSLNMKKDQYIPHEVSTRTCSQVINLIETEGCAGYGIYWALLEYLRVQENYIGDLQALSSLKRQLKIRQSKLDKVLYGYGLFVCDGKTFYSPKLIEVMKPFEDRRARIDAYKRNKENAKLLEINDKTTSSNDIVSFEVKGKGEGKVKGKKKKKLLLLYPLPLRWQEKK